MQPASVINGIQYYHHTGLGFLLFIQNEHFSEVKKQNCIYIPTEFKLQWDRPSKPLHDAHGNILQKISSAQL